MHITQNTTHYFEYGDILYVVLKRIGELKKKNKKKRTMENNNEIDRKVNVSTNIFNYLHPIS